MPKIPTLSLLVYLLHLKKNDPQSLHCKLMKHLKSFGPTPFTVHPDSVVIPGSYISDETNAVGVDYFKSIWKYISTSENAGGKHDG